MADVVCLRLMQAFRRVSRGMRRWQDGSAPPSTAPLSPRHIAALEQLLAGPLTVGELASRLGLTLPTVSGVLADLDRAGFIERHPDPADRRRTIVQVIPAQATLIGQWLDGAAKPIARVLDQLSPPSSKPSSKPWTSWTANSRPPAPPPEGRTPAFEQHARWRHWVCPSTPNGAIGCVGTQRPMRPMRPMRQE